ncbi:MAG: trypsin-like peptidase domain-containing protein, partial [Salinisphaeraceae bacterium]|nr:trypsin-like peptidase domain-containing protein [Salinisphaeraceae bacterium]
VDEVIALSKESNLALLRAPLTKTRPLEIVAADTNINIGEAAIAIAGTEGLQWHISYGQIVPSDNTQTEDEKTQGKRTKGNKTKDKQDNRLHFSTPLLAGNQGGPLVNRYGRVMGVLLPPGSGENKTAIHKAIPAKDIHALLDKINVLPLTATWTANPPPKPKPPPLLSELDIEDDITEEDIPIVDRVEKELASALQAEEEARQKAVAAAAAKAAEEKKKQATQAATKKPKKEAAQHLGQVKTIAWASVPSQPDPATICPPMISQHLDGEFRLVTTADRSRADGLLSLGGRLDTGKECNMWGCFDGYRLFMHFVISNQNGKTLYREYFEVDEDDVNEACEELAEDIVDELEDILDD